MRTRTSLMILVLGFSLWAAAGLRAQDPGKNFAASPQTWLGLGPGMGYFSWIYLTPGIGAKTDVEFYKATYIALTNQSPENTFFNAQLAADTTRKNAEQRLKVTLELLREHDREFFDNVMEQHGLALLNERIAGTR